MKPGYILFLICITHLQNVQSQNQIHHCAVDYWRAKALEDTAVFHLYQSYEQDIYQVFQQKKGPIAAPENTKTVPAVVHIVHDGGAENVSDAQVQQALVWLNQALANQGYYDRGSGANVGIQLCLAQRTPDGLASNGITRNQSGLTEMVPETQDLPLKNLNRWKPKDYINIWLVRSICSSNTGCGIYGYAFYPFSHGSAHDGIVMEATVVTAPEKVSGLAHELGHYLGLYHTFEGGCANNDCLNDGDRICDTPPDQSTVAVPCDQLLSTCSTDTQSGPFGSDQPDMFWNFMDYGTPACFHDFTPDQSTRMNATIDGIRHSLLDSKGCLPPCPTPAIAAFTASATTAALGEVIHFVSSSQNAAAFSWTLDGQSVGNQPDLDHTFWSEGTYIVQLTIQPVNPLLCEVGISQITIQASCPTTASFTVSNLAPEMGETIILTNTSQNATQAQWFVDGVSQGSVLDSLVLGSAGVYEISLVTGNGVCSDTATKVVYVQGPCVQKTFEMYINTSYNNIDNPSATNLETLKDGNLLIAYAGTRVAGGDNSPILVKMKPDGQILFAKEVGFDSTVLQTDVVVRATPDGGFVLVFTERDWVFADSQYFYLVKLSNNGTMSWAKRIPWAGNGDLDVLVNPDGSIITTGPALVKFSPVGTQIWAKHYLNGKLAPYPDGGFLILETNALLRFDAMGNLLWHRVIEIDPSSLLKDLIATPDGAIFVPGWVSAVGAGHGLMLKLNPDGETIWAKRYRQIPVSGYLFEAMTLASNGHLVIAGYATADDPGPGNFYPYHLMLEMDLDGNIVWIRHRPESFHTEDLVTLPGIGYVDLGRYTRILKTNLLGQTAGCPESPHSILTFDLPVTNSLVNITVVDNTLTFSPTILPSSDLDWYLDTLCAPVCQHTTEICNNLIDDDSDGLFDCLDPDCNCTEDVCAPKQGNLWYFGGKSGLDFNTDPPGILTDGMTNCAGVSSSICDVEGTLLFYSAGQNVYNRFHQPMPNGNLLNGNIYTSSFIIPHPGDSGKYFIVHTTGLKLYYSLVDLRLDDGRGDLVSSQKNIFLSDATFGLSAIKSCSFEGYWLLSFQGGNPAKFNAFRIDTNGFNASPVVTDYGQDITLVVQLKISPDGRRVACAAYPFLSKSRLSIHDFDSVNSGYISNELVLGEWESPYGLLGVEFSPTGRFLYASGKFPGDVQLLQFDLEAGSLEAIQNSRVEVVKIPGHNLGRLHLAPNGKIYMPQNIPSVYLDIIHRPEVQGLDCQYQYQGLELPGVPTMFGTLGSLCNVLPNYFVKPHIAFPYQARDSVCELNVAITYQLANIQCNVDAITWKSENLDAQIQPNGQSATIQYLSPGTGRIIVTAQTTCGLATDTLNVLVVPPLNKTLELGPDLVACENGVFTLNAGQGFARYQWSNGAEDSTTTTLLPGKYWVNVWDLCGNLHTDTVTVSIAPNTVLDLGPDLPQQCPGFSANYQRPPFFDAWHWSPADYLSCADCPAVTLSPGASAQWVIVAQTVHGCISVDTLSAVIRDTLFFEKDTFVCAGQMLALYGSNLPPDTSAQFFLPASGIGCDTLLSIHVMGLENASSQLDTVICPNALFVYQGIALPPDTLAYFHLANSSDCDSVVTVLVGSYPLLSLTLPMDTTIGIGASVLLDAQVEGTLGLNLVWSPTDALSCSDCTGPMANPLATVTYTLAVTDLNGCSVQGAVTVRINEECRIRVPNAFTPNGDGNNDLFRPVLDPCVHKVLVWKVTNRWGQVVSEQFNLAANDTALGWDGYFEGKQHPSDVLVWIAAFEYYDGKQETKSGEVTLVR